MSATAPTLLRPPNPPPLSGPRALVTGAGRGLGRALALAFAEAGAEVAVLSRSAAEIEAAAGEASRLGPRASAFVADVTSEDDVARVLAEIGVVDVLVNNAGTNTPQAFGDVDRATFDRLFALNVRAAFFLSQSVARRLVEEAHTGVILNVTSQMGHVGAAGRTVYCATKHALEGLTKAMAVELAPHGIRVNAIAPTYVETPMTKPFFDDAGFRADTVDRIPLGRIGTTDDVVGAAVFLASPAAALITGASLLIDGGYTAQ